MKTLIKKIFIFTVIAVLLLPVASYAFEIGPGVMWENVNGAWKYKKKDGSGYEKSTWIKDGKDWYYMNGSGVMHTAWRNIDGKYYYFTENPESGHPLGSLWMNTTTPDGYQVDGDGAMIGDTSGLNPYGYTAVEVNITAQTVNVYNGLHLVASSPCVTGKLTEKRMTHTGSYYIYAKETDRELKGDNEDGTKYSSHVNYWMPFNGGEGLHDATWRSNFGGTIYKNSGSHGCVNLPLAFAAQLYDIAYVGMPVEIHE